MEEENNDIKEIVTIKMYQICKKQVTKKIKSNSNWYSSFYQNFLVYIHKLLRKVSTKTFCVEREERENKLKA